MADAMTPLLAVRSSRRTSRARQHLGPTPSRQARGWQTIYVPTNNHALMKLVYPQFAYDP